MFYQFVEKEQKLEKLIFLLKLAKELGEPYLFRNQKQQPQVKKNKKKTWGKRQNQGKDSSLTSHPARVKQAVNF